MNETEALERLAAADPAAGADVTWAGPPDVLEPAHRPTRTVLLAAAAAVVLVAGIASALALTRGSHHAHDAIATAGAGGPTDPPDMFIAPGAPDPNPARTRALLVTLLADTPSLRHAVQVPRAPVAALRYPYSSRGSSTHEIRLTRWFTAPGSVAGATRFYNDNPPPGWSNAGGGGDDNFVGLDFDVADRGDRSIGEATVEVDIVPFRGGVAVRVDAYAFWLPSRTTDSIIGEPTAVVATVEHRSQNGRKTAGVDRRLSASAASTVAREIDALPGGVDVSHFCPPPPPSGTVTESLTFTTPHGTYVVTPTNSSCGSTTQLRTPAGRVYRLGLGTLFADVLAAAGLPKDYGHR